MFKGKDNLAKLVGNPISLDIINKEISFFYEEYITFGGYPKVVLSNDMQVKKSYLQHIFSTYIQKDIKDIGKIKEVHKFNNLLKILASQVGNLLNKTELSSLV
ncbi:MAG: hypothetical protein LBH92_07205 [Bacteroidales bacterium]|jgi:predicted AAA+ superfamily ATPase|nr:hypothetical protein [Bacteroidales bacterium]